MRLMQYMKYVGVVSFFALAQAPANAVPVLFEFTGTCNHACSGLNLNSGDSVSGGLWTDEDALSDGLLLTSEISSYWLNLGSILFDSTTQSAGALLFLNSDASGFSLGAFSVDNFLAWEPGGEWHLLLPPWLDLGNDPRGSGSFIRATSVPEPATLVLLGAGLLVLGGARLRRRLS